ncbi:hypothetical protein CRUP_014445, partial [Coryphaenoides rupestris]
SDAPQRAFGPVAGKALRDPAAPSVTTLGSIDCIQLINEEHMITGSDDGSVSVWSVNKKKPLSTVKVAHGSFGDAGLEQPHWVASVAALRNSDTVASGSHNSEIRLWACGQGTRSLRPLFSVPVVGPMVETKAGEERDLHHSSEKTGRSAGRAPCY